MKPDSRHILALKIAVIVLLSLAAAWVFTKGLVFSAALILVAIVAISVSIHYDRKKLIGRIEQLIAGIRHSDFSTYFIDNTSNDEISRLSREMNEALTIFRSRTHDAMMDEAESQAWQKLISVLTHEIMNSITPIISLSETLSEREIPDEADPEAYRVMRQAMETIHRRGKGLLSFVENYRKLTRLPQPSVQPILVQKMLESIQQLVASQNIRFTYSVYPEQLIVKADKGMLDQMLLNLLKNAHEACIAQTEPEIEVKAEKIGGEIHISVSDNGQGISPEAMEKIFIPFYSTKPTGSGIGLSICRQIMLRHKGKIAVTSDERGSRFTMIFPD